MSNIFDDRSTDFLYSFKNMLISIIGEVELEINKRELIQKELTDKNKNNLTTF